jgi:cation diffusion facilitator family transporter
MCQPWPVHEGSRKAIVAAFAANLAIAASKFVAFAFTGSAGLLAEAVHSVADTGNQGLLFLGGRRAGKEATDAHPFGFGRERYFWAFVVSVVLFTLGGAFAIYEGIDKLRHPHTPEGLGWAIGVLALAVVMESLSFRTARHAAEAERGDQSWVHFISRSKSPELPVVLLEDVGALVGLTFALAGVVIAKATGNARFDAAGSLAIGVLLCVIAMVLSVEMKSLLIGEAADPQTDAALREAFASHESVRRVIHVRTQHLGPDDLLVVAKLEFDPTLSTVALSDTINAVERLVRDRVPAARLLFIEPDYFRS